MPELSIGFTRRADGSSVLRCVRADGSATWQHVKGRNASFFPIHDLTHYVVERELGFRRGFFGLIAEGWDIEDTTGKSARGPLPAETLAVEHLVGLIGLERSGGTRWSAAELNEQLAALGVDASRGPAEEDLARIRSRIGDLLLRWYELPAGGTLELPFDRSEPWRD